MKKIIIASLVFLLLVAAGGGWYFITHRGDTMQQAKAALQKGDLRAAGIELRNLVRDQPANAEAHALLSQTQLASGDPIAAEKEIKRAAELGWDKSKVEEVLAQSYLAQSKWNEIDAEIPKAGATPAQTAYFLMTHAMAQRGQKDPAGSNRTLAEAEQADPGNAEVQIVAARFALADARRDLALRKLDRALELAPNRADALSLKAQLLAANGDRAAALALMDQAVASSPLPSTRLDRASLLLAQGQDAKAKDDVDAVLAKEPKNPAALYVDSVLLIRQGKFADADPVMQRLDPVIASFQRGFYFKAIVKANLGQVAQAEDSALAYVSRYPTDPDGVRLLARIELNARRPARAIPPLINLANAGQSDSETLDLLGRAYAMDGRRAEADKAFKQAAAAAPSNPAALTRLASSRLQAGDLVGAATDLERSLEIAPSQTNASQTLFVTSLALGDLDRAQQAIDRMREQGGETPEVGLFTGLLKLARLDTEGALEQLKATAAKYPNFAPAKLNAAKLFAETNRRAEAERILTEMVDKEPASSEPLAALVSLLLAENRGPDAVKFVERARAADPNNVGLVAGQSELYARLGDMKKAAQTLEAFKIDGKTPTPLLPLLGRAQVALGQTDAAKATFAAAVAAEPDNIGAVRRQVELLGNLKDFAGARRAATDALARKPGDLAALQLLLALEQLENGPDAALAMTDKLRADPANMPAAAVLRGDILTQRGLYKEAAQAFSDEFNQEPSSFLAVRLASVQRAGGDPAASDQTLRQWLASHPSDADAAQLLAASDIAARRFADAERNLQVVLSQRPNDVAALNNLAWVYQQRGDKRARQFAQRAYLQAPNPDVADTFAWILVSEGEPAKALPILQSASTARPANQTLKYHLAVALRDLNRRDEAIQVLRPLLEGTAEFEDKPAAQKLLADLTKPNP